MVADFDMNEPVVPVIRPETRALKESCGARVAQGRKQYYGYSGADIDPEQAAVVREIFERFAAGETQRAIASDLNHRSVPSPGATWDRRERTADGKWRVSAIHAMLRNERYIGRVIWNRSRWVRSAADSKRRKRVENPQSEWIVREGPAIIDRTLWSRVKARQDTGYASPRAYPRYLPSGLLECGVCGGKMTISGGRGHRYICGNRHTGVGCENDLGVSRILAEELILQPVTEELLSESGSAGRKGDARYATDTQTRPAAGRAEAARG
jgi:hypothetical protein